MGYLLGFIIAGYLAGKFVYDNHSKNFFKLFFATSFIYILGMLWLGSLIVDKPIFELGTTFLVSRII